MRYKDILSLAKENPEIKSEIFILAEETLRVNKSALLTYPEKEIENPAEFEKVLNELLGGRPLQYILGKWEFAGREFQVSEGVLIPREDTLALVELAKDFLKGKEDVLFADLGSGSGIIAITLALDLKARGYAVEKSADAFRYLLKNAEQAGALLKCINADMFEAAAGLPMLDMVVSNPPYITSAEMKELSKWVLNEPHEALFGGEDGLYFYRRIAKEFYPKLKRGGALAFEVGYLQADAVIEILENEGYVGIREKCDFGGTRRAVGGIKK